MRYLSLGIAFAAIMASQFSYASDIKTQLLPYFQQRLAGVSDEVSIELKTSPTHLLRCENPVFSTPANSRLWGNISVLMRCGSDKRFIQVQVGAIGHYVVATRSVPRGTILDSQSLTLKRGKLENLPAQALTLTEQAVNAVTLRDITPDMPLTRSMIRQPWLVKAGQQVQVVASGEGFSVNSEGRALNNVIAGQQARVRLNSGQIISGKVDADGNILINL
ncbi:flagellar basal body P-ring formation chaperone FlgA [Klebsiella sp. BIGb0407]|uniref:flagellar basal body P-ring formation chaperone FlgA n=1 Tax=Klebsiella sp. BIGb0407 TaxID=2940603 RepID=UPI002169A346|nr:flagellar basal body P-ring formation chaperone FlgA [Klebsiella sp. BIGb0407]MCS3433587.1 flagella basal body P-ring formation protein FlgA [Klebsiella sp. BIGb0407]